MGVTVEKTLRVPEFVSFAVGGLRLTARKAEDMATVVVIEFSLRGSAPKGRLLAYVEGLVSRWLEEAGAVGPLAWEMMDYDFMADYNSRSLPLHRITYQLSLLDRNAERALLEVIDKWVGAVG